MSFNESAFRGRIDQVLEQVKRVLDTARNPHLASDVQHEYEDKYLLAEFVANSSLAALLAVLELLGLSEKDVHTLRSWASKRSVTLELRGSATCEFDRHEQRKVESKSQKVTEYKGTFGSHKVTDKVVTTVDDYFWQYAAQYELYAYAGTSSTEKVVLRARSGRVELKTNTDTTPYPKATSSEKISLNITQLLKFLDDNLMLTFSIDRSHAQCHTPRRNGNVDTLLSFMGRWNAWQSQVRQYFNQRLFPVQPNHGLDMSQMNASGLFVPLAPLMEQQEEGRPLLSLGDVNAFLQEQRRSIKDRFDTLSKVYPSDDSLITMPDAEIVVLMLHSHDVQSMCVQGIDFIEHMLRQQLIAAIGKVVSPADFGEYMTFHNRKLYRSEFEPQLFSFAIRRPDHSPEGTLSIESESSGEASQPITTISRSERSDAPMYFPINAATNIAFSGDRYVHGWMSHQFSGDSGATLKLAARARQFSCFMLLVGRIAGANRFEPKHAVIVQNKDEIIIPLLLEKIPTPKEFEDAIASLSPEQQRFAQAFRSMQLESTLFGVAIIQIKPQLERLLNLPNDSLTKEIRLTQDLLEMFIKYQIPSDLLSYSGDADASEETKLATVKGYVEAMRGMVQAIKDESLAEAQQRQEFRGAQLADSAIISPFSSSACNTESFGMGAAMGMGGGMQMMLDSCSAFDFGGGGGGGGGALQMNVDECVPSGSADVPPEPPHDEPKYGAEDFGGEAEGEDYTKIPVKLDSELREKDVDNSVRPTIINVGESWRKKAQKSLLSKPTESSVSTSGQEEERDRAFDLLDGLTRSGVLPVLDASLHIVVAATHCFDKTVTETVVQDNVNPIEKVERTSLIIATTVHNKKAEELIKPGQLERVRTYSPGLFQ